MTRPPLVLDTDVISSFTCVQRMDILDSLYAEKMLVLPEVIYELTHKRKPQLLEGFQSSYDKGYIKVISLNPLGADGKEFSELRRPGKFGYGEAAVMAYVKNNGGTVCSNNMKDVLRFCQRYNLALLGMSGIMFDATKKGVIEVPEAEKIWSQMISRGRRLYFATMAEVISHYSSGPGASRGIQKY